LYEHLRGILEERSPAHAVVDVDGVGYRVAIPLSTYEKLPPVGMAAQLFVVLVVRDDSHRLYGFASRDEREFFLGLQAVSGVGPAVALGIVSSMTWAAFRSAIASGDAARLRTIRGGRASRDAQLALEQLGFAPDAAAAALSELLREEPSVEDAGELVRRALKRL
jgi:Holliday junction DNA helicase RuvA